MARSLRIEQAQSDHLVSEELGGAFRDRVEDLGERRPMRDRELDARELLEQRLALLEGRAHGPLGLEGAEILEHELEHSDHPLHEVDLIAGERVVTESHQQQRRELLVLDGRDHAATATDVGQGEQTASGRDRLGDRLLRRFAEREADRRDDPGLPDERSELGVDRLRDSLHRAACDVVGSPQGCDRPEELGQLIGRPVVTGPHQLTARTTSVWLWNPATPAVRAISPYV